MAQRGADVSAKDIMFAHIALIYFRATVTNTDCQPAFKCHLSVVFLKTYWLNIPLV